MHVLYVIDSLDRSGGAEQALAAMTPHLIARGVALDIAYLRERDGLRDELVDAGATVFPVVREGRPGRAVALTRLVRRRRPDLVHTTLFEADLAGRTAAVLARTPVVSSLVNIAYGPDQLASPGISNRRLMAARLADATSAQGVRRFHVLTEHVADTMAARLRVRRSRMDVVPRGRSTDLLSLRTPARAGRVRASLSISPDVPVLVAAARHEYQKGLDVLVAALVDVQRAAPSARLVIAGREGRLTADLQQMARASGSEESVLFLGARPDVLDLIAAADVFVAPSRWEGLGSAVVEAMGIGTPIVASDVAAIRETTGGTAALVPAGDPGRLAVAIVSSLTDRSAAVKRSRAAQRRFRERYTIDTVSDQMVAFYERSLAGGTRPGTRRPSAGPP
jgi:glycosyltransferase involved in cell wall biosynthesis